MKTIGILSPGDMGHSVGKVLVSSGLDIITCLKDRSERTRRLSREAGIIDVPSYQMLVQKCDMLLSIIVPGQAKNTAKTIAKEIDKNNSGLIFVDCNAVSPRTVQEIGRIIEHAGGRFLDACILGPPPRNDGQTRFYVSGQDTETFLELNQFGLDVQEIGPKIGDASALKMCYSGAIKGLAAIFIELLTTAYIFGVSDTLRKEFLLRQTIIYRLIEKLLPTVPERSRRWINEMEEISSTSKHAGLTPKIFQGVADIYRFVGETPLADMTPENRDTTLDLEKIVSHFAQFLTANRQEKTQKQF